MTDSWARTVKLISSPPGHYDPEVYAEVALRAGKTTAQFYKEHGHLPPDEPGHLFGLPWPMYRREQLAFHNIRFIAALIAGFGSAAVSNALPAVSSLPLPLSRAMLIGMIVLMCAGPVARKIIPPHDLAERYRTLARYREIQNQATRHKGDNPQPKWWWHLPTFAGVVAFIAFETIFTLLRSPAGASLLNGTPTHPVLAILGACCFVTGIISLVMAYGRVARVSIGYEEPHSMVLPATLSTVTFVAAMILFKLAA